MLGRPIAKHPFTRIVGLGSFVAAAGDPDLPLVTATHAIGWLQGSSSDRPADGGCRVGWVFIYRPAGQASERLIVGKPYTCYDDMEREISMRWSSVGSGLFVLLLCVAGAAQGQDIQGIKAGPAATQRALPPLSAVTDAEKYAPGHAAQAVGPGSAATPDEAAQEKLLSAAVEMIKQGRGAEAIAGPLDQIIGANEAFYAHSKKRIYCAASTAESLMYLLTAAKDHVDAQVLGKPTWASAYFLKAYALEDLGNLSDAESNLQLALKLSPSNSHYLSELGAIHGRQKDWPAALKTYQDAEVAAGTFAPENMKIRERCRALRGQGYVLVEQQRLDDAEQKYRQCLSIDPSDQASTNELGYVRQLKAKAAH